MIRSASVSSVFVLALLAVPGPSEAQDPPTRAGTAGVVSDTLPSHEARRELLRRRPFEPQAVPEFTGDRTIFYGIRPTQVAEGSQVLLVPAEEVPAMAEGAFHAAGWIEPEGDPSRSWGRIAHFAGGQDTRLGRTSVLPYDDVRLELAEGVSAAPGHLLLAVRTGDRIEDVGRIMVPTGVLEVLRVDDAGVVARLVRDFSKVELGNGVHAMRTFPLAPGVYPGETSARFEARVIAFEERKEIYLPGDRLFIDAGFDDGLMVGDEFRALAGESDGWQGADAAHFQVVGVQRSTATLRMLQSMLPGAIRPGITVVMTGAMP